MSEKPLRRGMGILPMRGRAIFALLSHGRDTRVTFPSPLEMRAAHQILTVSWIGVLLVTWGCKQPTSTSLPQTQATTSHHPVTVAQESSPAPEAAPLLLEEEPAGETSAKPAADNSRCFVCHVNYRQEKLAVTHAKADVGCVRCHGASDAHIADESWASGGNGTAPERMYRRDQINPSCLHCHSQDKLNPAQHVAVLADTQGKQVCTDCHGTHRLPQRRCKWK
jgi:hypothetical protein